MSARPAGDPQERRRSSDPDRTLAEQALFRIGVHGRLRRVATGLDSAYRGDLDDGRVVAVRVAGLLPIRRPAAVLMEAAWIDALTNGADVTVPSVVAPRPADGPLTVVDAEGRDRGCLALTWLSGRKARDRFCPHHAFALGAAAAHLHRHAASFEPPPDAWAKTWTPARMCGPSTDQAALIAVAGADVVDIADDVEARLVAAFAELGDKDWHVVNADLGPHNAVWVGRTPGLFDFNDLGWGYAGFDLGRLLHSLRWRPTGPQLVSAGLAGYQSVSPLPQSFRTAGDLFETAAGLFLAHHLAARVDQRGDPARRRVIEIVDDTRRWLASGTANVLR